MPDIGKQINKLKKNLRRALDRLLLGRKPAGATRAPKGLGGRARLIAVAATVVAVPVAIVCLVAGRSSAAAKARTAEATSGGMVIFNVTPSPTPLVTPTPTPDPTLKRGVESEAVRELQIRLMELGYLELDESTLLFGPATEAAVKLFQRQVCHTETIESKLDVDGVAGLQTLALIYSDDAPKYCVKEGMSGDDITHMQQQLVDLGYMRKCTGYYGDETIAAIKDFQSRNKLSADGLAGTATYDMLYSPNARESSSKANAARTTANISKMIEYAKDKLGCSYVLGNTGPNSFDCSGLVYYCLKQAGSNRRRLTAAGYSQVTDWEKISSMSSLKKGDLIFFYNNAKSKVGHVGIVISSGMMIDASSSNGKVVRRSYTTSTWKKLFVCGRRPW